MDKVEILRLLRNIGFIAEFSAALVGIIWCLKIRKFQGIIKWFPIFLLYIFLNDLIGINTKTFFPNNNNLIIFNISTSITFLYYFFLYGKFIKNKNQKKMILVLTIIYLTSLLINGFFENYLVEYQSIPYIIGASFILINVTLYFIQLLNSEEVLTTKHNLLFWVSVGLLIYYIGNIPFRIVRNYYANLADLTILFSLNFALTIIMNVFFIIGFIWSSNKQPY